MIRKQQIKIYVYNILIGGFMISAVAQGGWTTTPVLIAMIVFWLFECAMLYIKMEMEMKKNELD